MRDYTKIKAWQLADDLTVAVYRNTQSFPKEEVYSLTSQIRRAAYSVPALHGWRDVMRPAHTGPEV